MFHFQNNSVFYTYRCYYLQVVILVETVSENKLIMKKVKESLRQSENN